MVAEIDILLKAIALIERGWTQRAAARKQDQSPCGPNDPDAVAWCITGAIYNRPSGADFQPHRRAEKLARVVLGFDLDPKKVDSITLWNDNALRTADEVLDVLRAALAAAVQAAQAMTLTRTRQIFVPNNPRLLPLIGWRDPSGAFVPDDAEAEVDLTDGLFMEVESNEDTPTIPPPPGTQGEPSE